MGRGQSRAARCRRPGRGDAPSLTFAEGAQAPGGGFGNLDDDGHLQPEQPIETWVSTRMTYCFALGSLVGRQGDADRVDHGLAALLPGLRDDTRRLVLLRPARRRRREGRPATRG